MNQLQHMAYGYGAQAFVPQAAQALGTGENLRFNFDRLHSRLDGLGIYTPGYVPETPEQIARLFERLYPDTGNFQPSATVPGGAVHAFAAQQASSLQQLEREVQVLQQAILLHGRQLAALALHIIPSGGINRAG